MIVTIPEHITLTDISESPDNPLFELFTDVDVKYSFRGQTYKVTIPKGFTTDLGSIPKGLRGWISNVCVYDKCFLLHDWMFSKLGPDVSFDDANCILRQNLAFLGMNYFDRFCVYHAVNMFGKKRWKTKN